MGILSLMFHLTIDSLVNLFAYLTFRDTSRLPKEERPEAEAEAIVAGMILAAFVLFGLVAYFEVS